MAKKCVDCAKMRTKIEELEAKNRQLSKRLSDLQLYRRGLPVPCKITNPDIAMLADESCGARN
jgi:hypothetical protein